MTSALLVSEIAAKLATRRCTRTIFLHAEELRIVGEAGSRATADEKASSAYAAVDRAIRVALVKEREVVEWLLEGMEHALADYAQAVEPVDADPTKATSLDDEVRGAIAAALLGIARVTENLNSPTDVLRTLGTAFRVLEEATLSLSQLDQQILDGHALPAFQFVEELAVRLNVTETEARRLHHDAAIRLGMALELQLALG